MQYLGVDWVGVGSVTCLEFMNCIQIVMDAEMDNLLVDVVQCIIVFVLGVVKVFSVGVCCFFMFLFVGQDLLIQCSEEISICVF